jgi:hypothetical protein
MADHLDYIRIRGLESGADEMFQGALGCGASDGSADSAPALEWGDMPEDVVTMLGQYTDDVNAWLTEMQSYDPSEAARGITALAIPPAVPALFTALALSGAGVPALPVVATVMVTQAIVNTMGSSLQSLANRYDANSLEYIFRKAMLYKDAGNVEQSVLNDRLSDLAYVDEIIDFGPFRVHIKGKMIEYA